MTTVVRDAPAPSPSTLSSSWLKYFRQNCNELLTIPWDQDAGLTGYELRAISASIQGFQLGESSEGRHLIKCARQYAKEQGDPDYCSAIELFIKEEQRHARDLGRFMDLAGIPRIGKTWPDSVFRRLRHSADLEVSISVLLTAEIIAKVYYPALRAATQSGLLRAICDQIIRDEAPHVRFQAERLAILRKDCGLVSLAARHALHRILYWGTCLVVWYKHGRAMRQGGLSLWLYLRRCLLEFAEARRVMDPRWQADDARRCAATT